MTDKQPELEQELKTIKFQLMLAPSEAEQIDDWMFKHRVRSRAEAIRRLCQMGMVIDGRLLDLAGSLGKLAITQDALLEALRPVMPAIRENPDILKLVDALFNFLDTTQNMDISIREALLPITPYMVANTFDEALLASEKRKEKAAELRAASQEFLFNVDARRKS